ncbi:MAG: type II toxin-antitoxin system RelE/ParE family toxin [Robiginitomaculum sp.]|nr:type II toxin-antitoxin system RelE/ParE family toxin [Robiginitomaculum sp.]
MAVIKWLPEAKNDLRRLYNFILPHSPQAASRAIDTILKSVDVLVKFPETGQPWEPDTGYRELHIRFGAKGYTARYRLFENQVIIARVWHSLEDR